MEPLRSPLPGVFQLLNYQYAIPNTEIPNTKIPITQIPNTQNPD